MKTRYKISIFSFIALMSFLMLASCKKKDTAPTPAAIGTLYFHIHTNVDTTEADSGVIAADVNHRRIQLNIAQMYISNVVLHKPDASTYSIHTFLLKNIANEAYLVATDVPSGNYTSVSFDVGLDAGTNADNPSSFAPSVCLSPQNPSMWFGSTAQGYEFVNVQGFVDTTALNNGSVNWPISYQLGTSSMLKTVNLPNQSFSVVTGQVSYVHIIADYGLLLQGINFKTQNTATPFVNSATATQISNNIPNMFRYEY